MTKSSSLSAGPPDEGRSRELYFSKKLLFLLFCFTRELKEDEKFIILKLFFFIFGKSKFIFLSDFLKEEDNLPLKSIPDLKIIIVIRI